MDARSIAATAANKGFLTPATDMDVEYKGQKYHFDQKIYANRVFDSHGVADPDTKIKFGPNIKDWPAMSSTSGESGIESCIRDSRSGYNNE